MKARWVALDASYTALHDNLKQAKQDVDVINTWVDLSEERDELFEEYTRLNAVCEIGRDAANRREKAAISGATSTPTTFSSSVKLHSLSKEVQRRTSGVANLLRSISSEREQSNRSTGGTKVKLSPGCLEGEAAALVKGFYLVLLR